MSALAVVESIQYGVIKILLNYMSVSIKLMYYTDFNMMESITPYKRETFISCQQ